MAAALKPELLPGSAQIHRTNVHVNAALMVFLPRDVAKEPGVFRARRGAAAFITVSVCCARILSIIYCNCSHLFYARSLACFRLEYVNIKCPLVLYHFFEVDRQGDC